MTHPIPPDARTSTGTLLFTLLLGFLIGFSLCYALLGAPGFPGLPTASPPEPPVAAPPQEAVQMAEPVAPQPEPPVTAPVEDSLWPGRHLFIGVAGTALSEAEESLIRGVLPGGVVLTASNLADPAQTKALVDRIKMVEGLGAADPRLPLIAAYADALPDVPPAAVAQWQSTEAARVAGRTWAAACKTRGVDILFAPDLDVSAASGVEGQPGIEKTLAMGLAFADELMRQGVIAVAAYYPGRGVAKPESAVPVIDLDLRALSERLYPFSEAIARNIPGVLAGHVAVPIMDKDQPYLPASLSPKLVRLVLREKWMYEGVIVAENVAAIPGTGVETAVVQALGAGCDAVVLQSSDPMVVHSACTAVEQAMSAGYLSRAQLEASKTRLDAWVNWLQAPAGLKGELPEVEAPAPAVTPEPPTETPVPQPEPVAEPTPESEPAPAETPAPETAEAPAEPAPAPVPAPAPAKMPEPVQPPNTTAVSYEVQPGDRLARIASKYEVAVSDVVAWNNLKSADDIKYGQRLTIYVPIREEKPAPPQPEPVQPQPEPEQPSEVTPAEPATVPAEPVAPSAEPTPAPSESPAPAVAEPPAPPADEPPVAVEPAQGQPETAPAPVKIRYLVEPGDTLRSIARKYRVSYRDIMEWNGMSDGDSIQAGRRLDVYVPQNPAPGDGGTQQ